jgi:hypothetical protein
MTATTFFEIKGDVALVSTANNFFASSSDNEWPFPNGHGLLRHFHGLGPGKT